MRIFTASLATETNTFSPIPVDLAAFRESFYAPPGAHPETPTLCSAPMTELRRAARETPGLEVIEGTATWAEPAGIVSRSAYETLRDEILGQLKVALPVDAVVLGLHGAMVAQGYEDCEGDLLGRVRALAGPKILIAVEMDPHSHLTPARVAASDIIVFFKEFPHTDFALRARDLVDLTLRTLRGEVRPVISTFDCRMIEVLPTSREPMRGFVDRMSALEGRDGVLSVSVVHGFMAADVPEMGTRVVVVTDGKKEAGDRLAERLGRELFSFRGKTRPPYLGVDAGIDAALAAEARPAIIADAWDNPGGGSAGDGTFILRRLIERNVEHAAVATIWDPMAVKLCFAAGEGARLALRLGGKTHDNGGAPLDATVTVERLERSATQTFGASIVPLGDAAVVRIGGVRVVVNSVRSQAFEPTVFSNLGIDPAKERILVVKSTNHFHAGFARLGGTILYVDAGGPYISDPRRIPYTRLTRRLWPMVEDPFAD